MMMPRLFGILVAATLASAAQTSLLHEASAHDAGQPPTAEQQAEIGYHKSSKQVTEDSSILKETAHHSAAATSKFIAEVNPDGTVRRSDSMPGAETESALQNEAVRSVHRDGKARKGKAVEQGAIRADQQMQNDEAKVGPGGIDPRIAQPENTVSDVPLKSAEPSIGLWWLDKYYSSWSWIVSGVALVVLALTLVTCYKPKGSKAAHPWQKVSMIDAFLSKQYDLRREVAKAEGWDKHFPPKDVPSSLCTGICYLERVPSRKWIEQSLTKLAQKAPRFGATFKGDPQVWESVAKLDLNYHIVEHKEVSTKKSRDELMQALMHKEAVLDMEKPLWRFHVVPCETDDSLLMFSFSHAIGDAVSIVPMMWELVGTDKDGKYFALVDDDLKKAIQAREPGKFMEFFFKIWSFLSGLPYMGEALAPPDSMPPETRLPCHNPERFLDRPFSGPLSMTPANQHILNFPLVPINYIKALKNKAKTKEGLEMCTVNDVLFSVYLGTLRRYCEDIGGGYNCHDAILEPGKIVKELVLRGCILHNTEAMMKIAKGEPVEVGNGFEFYIGHIGDAMGQVEADERLKCVAQTFDKDKNSGRPYAAKIANALIPHVLGDIKDLVPIMAQQQTKVTFSLSAMSLPNKALYLDGIKVKDMRGVYHNNIPTLISISYADNVGMSINICAAALKGWERMPGFFIDELKALGQSLGVSTMPLRDINIDS